MSCASEITRVAIAGFGIWWFGVIILRTARAFDERHSKSVDDQAKEYIRKWYLNETMTLEERDARVAVEAKRIKSKHRGEDIVSAVFTVAALIGIYVLLSSIGE